MGCATKQGGEEDENCLLRYMFCDPLWQYIKFARLEANPQGGQILFT